MERSSSFSTPIRVTVVLFGGVLVLAGWFWRSLNQEYTAFPTETVRFDDGTVAVYEPDAEGDWPQWEVVVDESAEDSATVVQRASENAAPVEVFSGTRADAAEWALTRGREPLFVGSAEMAEAWIDEREQGAENALTPMVLMVGGGVIALIGAITGWDRRPLRAG